MIVATITAGGLDPLSPVHVNNLTSNVLFLQ